MNHPHEQQAAAMDRAGELPDSEQLREYVNSGQVSAAQVVAHEAWETWQFALKSRAAQSQPAPPVPSDVQEIMPLVNTYVRACGEFLISGDDGADEALKPLQAALTALVADNHRLKFELDGVRGTAETEPKCETCGGRGQVTQSERIGESEFNEWDIDCPVCDGVGHAPGSLQKHISALNARIDRLQREAYDWWAAANALSSGDKDGVRAMRGPEWVSVDDRSPEYASRDDTPCIVHGKEIPPTLSSKTVLVALTGGGVRTDKFITIEGAPGWWNTYGKRVTHWMPPPPTHGIEPEQGGNHG